ncbi:PAS sensor protein [Methylorubrum populi]|uniref:histidine kinase n=1 Tax=Methylorubrum populi TaxID=223967 RepID=A0A169QWC4_9HYPH|nr:PAS domain-containing protein [Methylorubrum populi]BAU90372.1 PAS sensor protein [Methylorubrum populi]
MNAADLSFSSSEFLQLLEGLGLTGNWGWTFATGEQVWSPGLFRLLGLEAGTTVPSYERITQLVHPEDRYRLERADDVRHEGVLGEHTVRVLRPDGMLRVLNLRGTVYHTPDGRPRAAAGIVLDVTDREQMASALRTERRRQWALFEVLQSWSNSALYVGGQRVASPEILSLTGVTQEAFQAHCDQIVAPDDRARMRAHIQAMIAAGKSFEVSKRLIMADGDQGQFRFLYTPVRDAEGRTETWATHAARLSGPKAPVLDQARKGLVQGIEGRHLRAARALLGWSMQDLAQAGGLSFATVRRLEESEGGRRAHSHDRAVAALQRAGIGFQIVEGNRIAVFRR